MGKQTINVLTDYEVEQVAYETFTLLENGWKRIYLYATDEYTDLAENYDLSEVPNYLWVKPGYKHYNRLYDKMSRDYEDVEVQFFSREDAFDTLE